MFQAQSLQDVLIYLLENWWLAGLLGVMNLSTFKIQSTFCKEAVQSVILMHNSILSPCTCPCYSLYFIWASYVENLQENHLLTLLMLLMYHRNYIVHHLFWVLYFAWCGALWDAWTWTTCLVVSLHCCYHVYFLSFSLKIIGIACNHVLWCIRSCWVYVSQETRWPE